MIEDPRYTSQNTIFVPPPNLTIITSHQEQLCAGRAIRMKNNKAKCGNRSRHEDLKQTLKYQAVINHASHSWSFHILYACYELISGNMKGTTYFPKT